MVCEVADTSQVTSDVYKVIPKLERGKEMAKAIEENAERLLKTRVDLAGWRVF